jgi:hypothetical protein
MQDGEQPSNAGQVIKPGDQTVAAELPVIQATDKAPSVPTGIPESQQLIPEPPVAEVPQPPLEQPSSSESDGFVEWTASEYVANPKSAGWFITLTFAFKIQGG